MSWPDLHHDNSIIATNARTGTNRLFWPKGYKAISTTGQGNVFQNSRCAYRSLPDGPAVNFLPDHDSGGGPETITGQPKNARIRWPPITVVSRQWAMFTCRAATSQIRARNEDFCLYSVFCNRANMTISSYSYCNQTLQPLQNVSSSRQAVSAKPGQGTPRGAWYQQCCQRCPPL
jgi:hypothetical protein